MAIEDITIQAVRDYSGIVELISEYVSIKKRGNNYVGLCPFHSEKSPSFTVSPQKLLFHCFGCHESGDTIAFLMKIDNLSFTEAVRLIAKKAGIEIKESKVSLEQSLKQHKKERLIDCLFDAKQIFLEQLENHEEGRQYLLDRGLIPETMTQFQLGFAHAKDTLREPLQDKAYKDQECCDCGLYYLQEQGEIKPRFRDRIMIPILDHRGKTLAFGGRIIQDNKEQAKYINSPETELFNKSWTLFGLDQAKFHIKKLKSVIVMEGFMDVMMAHQYGFQNVVGSMGTALTNGHAKLLKRFADHVCLALDSDNAGQAAIQKSYPILRKEGLTVKVIQFKGKDPADLLREKGKEAFSDALDQTIDIIPFQFNLFSQSANLSDIHAVSQVVDQMIPFLKAEEDRIIRQHYLDEIALKLKINKELILAKLETSVYNTKAKKYIPKQSIKNKYQKAEEFLIYATASSLQCRIKFKKVLSEDDFQNTEHQSLFRFLTTTDTVKQHLVQECTNTEIKKSLSRILVEFSQKNDMITDEECEDCIAALKDLKRKNKIEEIREELKDNESLSEKEETSLLERLNQLISKNER